MKIFAREEERKKKERGKEQKLVKLERECSIFLDTNLLSLRSQDTIRGRTENIIFATTVNKLHAGLLYS